METASHQLTGAPRTAEVEFLGVNPTSAAMKIGLAGINVGTMAVPEVGRLAALAEDLGYESLWTAEHIVLPDVPPGETPRPGTMPFLDSMARGTCDRFANERARLASQ